MIKIEDIQNERRPKLKTTKIEDNQNGRQPKWNMTRMEDDQNERRPKLKNIHLQIQITKIISLQQLTA